MSGSRDPILEFRDPLISRVQLELETSNLSRRRTADEKNAKLAQKGSCGGHVTQLLEFGFAPNISQTVKPTNFKFGRNRTAVSSNEKNAKLGQPTGK